MFTAPLILRTVNHKSVIQYHEIILGVFDQVCSFVRHRRKISIKVIIIKLPTSLFTCMSACRCVSFDLFHWSMAVIKSC